jgi:hypothetical protein|nr:MAG TPA: hypothetical protein [Caudoviricetes sp.]
MMDVVVLLNTLGAGEFLFERSNATIGISVRGVKQDTCWRMFAKVTTPHYAFGCNNIQRPSSSTEKTLVMEVLLKALSTAVSVGGDTIYLKEIIRQWSQ